MAEENIYEAIYGLRGQMRQITDHLRVLQIDVKALKTHGCEFVDVHRRISDTNEALRTLQCKVQEMPNDQEVKRVQMAHRAAIDQIDRPIAAIEEQMAGKVSRPLPPIAIDPRSEKYKQLQADAKIGRLVQKLPPQSQLYRTRDNQWRYDPDPQSAGIPAYQLSSLLETLTKGGLTDDSDNV